MGAIEHRALLHVDVVAWCVAACHGDVVADLALDRDVRDQAVPRLGVHARHVAGIGIAVRITVVDVEKEDEVVPVGDR